jgi:hypothetical protein
MKYMNKAEGVLGWEEIRRRENMRETKIDFSSGSFSCLHDFMFSGQKMSISTEQMEFMKSFYFFPASLPSLCSLRSFVANP